MKPIPHSRAWYSALGADYAHPWQQDLLELSGETLFDSLLEQRLANTHTVLEAGCAGGRDALRFATRVRHWVGYDFAPDFLETAQSKGIANASFIGWHSSREPIPAAILAHSPFDVVVSRRGPTSIVPHLPYLTSSQSQFIYVAPDGADLLHTITANLEAVAWQVVWSVVVEARGWLPTFEDYALHAEYNSLEFSGELFLAKKTERGFPLLEKRCVLIAMPK